MKILARFRSPLSRSERADLRKRIATAERTTAGEIAIFLQRRRRKADHGQTLEQLGLNHFYALGMEKTSGRTGILLYLHLAERKLRLVADEAIHAKVPQAEWDALKALFLAAEGRLRTFVFLDPTDNLFRFSETLDSTVGQKDGLLASTAGVTDPVGTSRAAPLAKRPRATHGGRPPRPGRRAVGPETRRRAPRRGRSRWPVSTRHTRAWVWGAP